MKRSKLIKSAATACVAAVTVFAFQNCGAKLQPFQTSSPSTTPGVDSGLDTTLLPQEPPVVPPTIPVPPAPPQPPVVKQIENKAWEKITTMNAPGGRQRGTVVWTGSKMIIWGGDYNSATPASPDGSIYDPATKIWKPISTVNAPVARRYHNAIWDGSRMLIFGGGPLLYATDKKIEGTYAYDPVNDSWSKLADPGMAGNMGMSVLYNGKVVSIGYAFAKTYDSAANTWSEEPLPLLSSSLNTFYHAASSMVGSKIFVLNPWMYPSDHGEIFTYDFATKTKTEIQFPKRTVHTFPAFAYTGKEILIWGTLYGFSSPTAAGEIYNPETNTWTTMTEVNNPGPKIEYPRGVWTGKEFLVFDENNPSVIWSLK